MLAFRCKSCGHLETSEQAGECNHPISCRVCSGGVKFNDKGHKVIDDSNWEVLADMSEQQLEEIGCCKDDVCKHVPMQQTVNINGSQNINRNVSEDFTAQDKT